MPELQLLIFTVIGLALLFDFINGFHDTANAIATSVSTRALHPSHAIIMAAFLNFLGAMYSTGVAKTIGVAHDEKVAKIAVLGIPNTPGIAHEIFSALAEANIDVDMIVQSIRNIEKNVTDMVFTVATDDLAQAKKVVDKVADKLNAIAVLIEEDVAKVSIVGAGMLGNPGIAARMFGALSKAQINIDIISTSEISISCLVKGSQLKEAVNAIHDEFFPAKA